MTEKETLNTKKRQYIYLGVLITGLLLNAVGIFYGTILVAWGLIGATIMAMRLSKQKRQQRTNDKSKKE